ncbi:MAG TPA: branched-chain amino acid ABC transporter permease [Acidimicrobiales bacterium]
MHLFVQSIIIGVLIGGVYALLASGMTMMFGVTRIINFAQAMFAIVCAYLSYSLFTRFGLDPFLSVVILMPMMFLSGYGVYALLLRRLTKAGPAMALMVLFALGIGAQGVTDLVYGTNPITFTPSYANDSWALFGFQIPAVRFFAFVMAVAVLGTFHMIRQHSKLGRALRATSQNTTAASLLGVDVQKMSAVATGLGFAAAGAAGPIYGLIFPFTGNSQYDLLGKLLTVMILGGLVSMPGVIIAAVFLGVVESVIAAMISPDWSSFSFLVALFIVLMVRPQGLFGGHRVQGALW